MRGPHIGQTLYLYQSPTGLGTLFDRIDKGVERVWALLQTVEKVRFVRIPGLLF